MTTAIIVTIWTTPIVKPIVTPYICMKFYGGYHCGSG